MGIESLGRIRPTHVKLLAGLNVTIYNVAQTTNGVKEVFICLLHPLSPEPFWFKQEHKMETDGVLKRMSYSSWQSVEAPTELKGYRSSATSVLTEKQLKMWHNNAAKYRLDPEQPIDAKKFSLLPVLIAARRSL